MENREHHARGKTSSQDLQQVRTGNQPGAHAAIRNLVTGAIGRARSADTARARRCHGRNDQRTPAPCGYA